jgi:hypothetical protein
MDSATYLTKTAEYYFLKDKIIRLILIEYKKKKKKVKQSSYRPGLAQRFPGS